MVIDTSAYSWLERGHDGVLAAMRRCDRVILSPVVIGELRMGFREGSREALNLARLSEFVNSPAVKLISVDHKTAERFAEIQCYLRKIGKPLPINDVWIAATAMQHGCAVLTLDRHFLDIPHVITELIPPQ